ncbi:serine/threonine-protein kinase [Paraliomyxa miuraensis]|uniref:serine/threonine-protein kinase n=1 Tax=Paraliomyxa miuraensis TaxID=376150 RepID=UPI002253AF41|nr:serine/threonine-protein kinase [Paraliomyxa miuraensis]MCX4240406.1 serine/threonine protein kinase [Paraliomyxa miuraensis]
MPEVPDVIGNYEVVGLLGKGAMGEVYEGRDPGLGRRVALKILGARHRESREFKERFLREGRALAAMNHPNIVQIYQIGDYQDRPFLAMEFLDGEDLGQAIKKRGPINPGDAAEVIRQAAIGLGQAQQAGVVHHDVKPSNLVVTTQGAVKVTDFGLAKALQEDLSITATGVFVGTPDYLAPEQAMGEEVDARADVYALGCSLFHMCSGHPPFRKGGQDDHYTAVVRRHLKAERPQLKMEIQGFDEELSDLCRRMMSRRPDVRPTFSELVEKLGGISQRLGGRVPPRHQDIEPLQSSSASTNIDTPAAEDDIALNPGRSSRAVAIAVVAGIVIGIGVTVGVVLMVG